jgi:hypothetical protein
LIQLLTVNSCLKLLPRLSGGRYSPDAVLVCCSWRLLGILESDGTPEHVREETQEYIREGTQELGDKESLKACISPQKS